MIRRALVLVFIAAVVVAACGGDSDPVADDPAIESAVDSADVGLGEEVYGNRCVACHGPEGQGLIGPALQGVTARVSVSEQHQIVFDGRGQMPSWGGKIPDDEIFAVIAYTRATFG